jgi:hypothetical protein
MLFLHLKNVGKNKFVVVLINRIDIYFMKSSGEKIKHKTGAEN